MHRDGLDASSGHHISGGPDWPWPSTFAAASVQRPRHGARAPPCAPHMSSGNPMLYCRPASINCLKHGNSNTCASPTMQQRIQQPRRAHGQGGPTKSQPPRPYPHVALPVAIRRARQRHERLDAQRREAQRPNESLASVEGTVDALKGVVVHTGIEQSPREPRRAAEKTFTVGPRAQAGTSRFAALALTRSCCGERLHSRPDASSLPRCTECQLSYRCRGPLAAPGNQGGAGSGHRSRSLGWAARSG